MADIRQPDELVLLTGNIAENWRKFRQEFELYMIASGHDGKPEKQKVALLLHVARKQAIDVFNTFALTEEQKADYDVVVQRFETQHWQTVDLHLTSLCLVCHISRTTP